MKIILSICVAIYNIKEEFLRECIESVIKNKAPEIEIILGDDCSKEYVREICLEYKSKDERIKYIRPEKNGGVSAVRNLMIENASGRFITFVDGDDVVTEDYAEKILAAAEKNFDIVMFGIKRFCGEAPKIQNSSDGAAAIPQKACREFSIACLTGSPTSMEEYGMKQCTPSSVCLEAYRREFLLKNNLRFTEGIKKSQDTLFNTSAYYCCNSLGYMADILYLYRGNPASVCNRYSADFDKMMFMCFECDEKNLQRLYNGDEKIKNKLYKYKLILIITDNFRLNIFHKDNPKSKKERKADFLKFRESEPYAGFFENFDFSSYNWRERKLILKLAKNRRFEILDFMYKYPVTFKIYGWTANKLSGLKRGK